MPQLATTDKVETLNFTRISTLRTAINKAIEEWAAVNGEPYIYELGHAFLSAMLEAARSPTIVAVIPTASNSKPTDA